MESYGAEIILITPYKDHTSCIMENKLAHLNNFNWLLISCIKNRV